MSTDEGCRKSSELFLSLSLFLRNSDFLTPSSFLSETPSAVIDSAHLPSHSLISTAEFVRRNFTTAGGLVFAHTQWPCNHWVYVSTSTSCELCTFWPFRGFSYLKYWFGDRKQAVPCVQSTTAKSCRQTLKSECLVFTEGKVLFCCTVIDDVVHCRYFPDVFNFGQSAGSDASIWLKSFSAALNNSCCSCYCQGVTSAEGNCTSTVNLCNQETFQNLLFAQTKGPR